MARWHRATPWAPAVIENATAYSYATLATNIVQAAKLLAAAGLRRRMIVGIECGFHYLHLVMILACEVLGAAHVCLVGDTPTPDDDDLIARCDFLCAATWLDRAPDAPRRLRLSWEFVEAMTAVAVQAGDFALLEQTYPAADLVRIGRTSGTTGRSRFVGCSRRSLNTIVHGLPDLLKSGDQRQNFVSAYHFALMGTYSDSLLALQTGSTVIYGGWHDLAANARRHAPCRSVLVVRDAITLANGDHTGGGRVAAWSIRLIGGFVPPALRAALQENVAALIVSTYASNETSHITSSADDAAGVILPDVAVRIVDDAGRDLGPGEPGIILARTPRMADRYLWDEAATARHFVDGWFRTSDIGYLPEPGRLIVLGRADEMLNLSGIKVAPHPIEAGIRAIDGVTDAVLLGLDDALGATELHVVIERQDPALDHGMTARLTPLLAGIAASFKLHCVDRLPRAPMGKVQRNLLRQSLESPIAAAGAAPP